MSVTVERDWLSVPEAGERLFGCKPARAYEAAAQGLIPTVRLGRRLLVPRRALDALAEEAVAQVRERLTAGAVA